MKIKTIKLNKMSAFDSINPQKEREVKCLIILLALFASGIIIGSGAIKSWSDSDTLQNFLTLFDVYIEKRTTQSFFSITGNSMLISTVLLLLAFFSGLSCVGIPIIVIIPVIKGLGIGLTAGHLFSQYAINGIGYYLLTIFPGLILSSVALLLSTDCSINMSTEVLSVFLGKKTPLADTPVSYIKKYLIIFTIIIFSSMIDGVTTKAFAYLFTF